MYKYIFIISCCTLASCVPMLGVLGAMAGGASRGAASSHARATGANIDSNFYRITIKRENQNIYSFVSGSISGIIQTKYCYEFAYSEEAILKWNGAYHHDNKIIFNSGSSCDVANIFTN